MNYEYTTPISERAYQMWKDHLPLNPIGQKCYQCKKKITKKAGDWGYNRQKRQYCHRTCGLAKEKKTYGKNNQRG